MAEVDKGEIRKNCYMNMILPCVTKGNDRASIVDGCTMSYVLTVNNKKGEVEQKYLG